jgi:hypothetical protein
MTATPYRIPGPFTRFTVRGPPFAASIWQDRWVTDVPSSPLPSWAQPEESPPQPRLSPVRRALGLLAVACFVLLVPISVAGVWNPWRYVLLQRDFGNPLADLMAIALVAAVAAWLLAPVRNEAVQHRRVWLRWGTVAAFLAASICFGAFGQLFAPGQVQTVGRFGDLQAVVETHGENAEIRMWAGSGWAVRDMGRIGRACGPVSAFFTGRTEVQISTSYGDFRIPLDERTGRPLRQLGPTCLG